MKVPLVAAIGQCVFWGSETICVLGVEDDVMWLCRWSMWLCMGTTMVHWDDERVAQYDVSIGHRSIWKQN
jgi:hypothetical protein